MMATFLPVLVVAVILGLGLAFFARRSKPVPTDRPEPGVTPTIHRLRANIRAILARDYPGTTVSSYGATEIDLRDFTVTITTATDRERDQIRRSEPLRERFRQALIDADYPRTAIPRVVFEIESLQAIRRDEAQNQARR